MDWRIIFWNRRCFKGGKEKITQHAAILEAILSAYLWTFSLQSPSKVGGWEKNQSQSISENSSQKKVTYYHLGLTVVQIPANPKHGVLNQKVIYYLMWLEGTVWRQACWWFNSETQRTLAKNLGSIFCFPFCPLILPFQCQLHLKDTSFPKHMIDANGIQGTMFPPSRSGRLDSVLLQTIWTKDLVFTGIGLF